MRKGKWVQTRIGRVETEDVDVDRSIRYYVDEHNFIEFVPNDDDRGAIAIRCVDGRLRFTPDCANMVIVDVDLS